MPARFENQAACRNILCLAGWFFAWLATPDSALWAADAPASILDLSVWKLTLPVESDRLGTPDEVLQPELANFSVPDYFASVEGTAAVKFRAPCDGVPTRGSKYPRTELREMQPGGTTRAAWGTADGMKHSLSGVVTVTHLPEKKPHLICAQIHDQEDLIFALRVEQDKLIVEGKDHPDQVIDKKFVLNQPFQFEIACQNGEIVLIYNREQTLKRPATHQGCYFKAGCYTQSNLQKGDRPDAYGEVVISQLKVVHSP